MRSVDSSCWILISFGLLLTTLDDYKIGYDSIVMQGVQTLRSALAGLFGLLLTTLVGYRIVYEDTKKDANYYG